MDPVPRNAAQLAQEIDGHVLLPGAADYESARQSFVARFDTIAPRVIVGCAHPGDVARAIAFAEEDGWPLAARSGGHCYGGRSSTSGVLIDVSPMRSVSVAGNQATIAAGARLGEVYEQLLDHDTTIPGGSCPTVGIAGLTLGGGFGILGRTYGLTCDRLVAAEVVLADGRVVEADDEHHSDLFWALRGAGGGRFGVVTSLRYEMVPATAMTNFRAEFPFADAAALIVAWQHWSPSAADELTASLLIRDHGQPGHEPTLEVVGALLGTEAEMDGLLDELVAAAGCLPAEFFRQEMSLRDTRSFWAQLDGGEIERHGHRYHKSEYFQRPLPTEAVTAQVEHFRGTALAGRYRELDFSPWGGAYNRVPTDATAFAHRDHLFLFKHTADVDPASPTAQKQAAHRWVTDSWATVHPYGSGAIYPNFPDPDLDDWDISYHGGNLERLREVAAAYDPNGLFRRAA